MRGDLCGISELSAGLKFADELEKRKRTALERSKRVRDRGRAVQEVEARNRHFVGMALTEKMEKHLKKEEDHRELLAMVMEAKQRHLRDRHALNAHKRAEFQEARLKQLNKAQEQHLRQWFEFEERKRDHVSKIAAKKAGTALERKALETAHHQQTVSQLRAYVAMEKPVNSSLVTEQLPDPIEHVPETISFPMQTVHVRCQPTVSVAHQNLLPRFNKNAHQSLPPIIHPIWPSQNQPNQFSSKEPALFSLLSTLKAEEVPFRYEETLRHTTNLLARNVFACICREQKQTNGEIIPDVSDGKAPTTSLNAFSTANCITENASTREQNETTAVVPSDENPSPDEGEIELCIYSSIPMDKDDDKDDSEDKKDEEVTMALPDA